MSSQHVANLAVPRGFKSPLGHLAPAVRLGVLADIEMQAGHHEAAERLAHQAETLRMTGADRLLQLIGGTR